MPRLTSRLLAAKKPMIVRGRFRIVGLVARLLQERHQHPGPLQEQQRDLRVLLVLRALRR